MGANHGNATSRADEEILDGIARAIARSASGVDDRAAEAIRMLLAKRMHADELVIVEVEPVGAPRLLGRAPVPGEGSPRSPLPLGLPWPAANSGPLVQDSPPELCSALHGPAIAKHALVVVPGEGEARAILSLGSRDAAATWTGAHELLGEVAVLLGPTFARLRHHAKNVGLAAAFRAAGSGMLLLDQELVVREANATAERLLQKTRAELVGRPLGEVLPGISRPALLAALEREGGALPLGDRGDLPAVDVNVTVFRGAPVDTYVLTVWDGRERRSGELALSRRLEHLSFLRLLGESLGSDLRVQTALERALDICVTHRPIRVIAALRADATGTLRLAAMRGGTTDLSAKLAWIRRDQLEALRAGDEWTLTLPLSHARRTWGSLFVVGRSAGDVPPHERELWDSVGATVSAALHAAQDFEHVVELEAERRLLVDSLPVIVARIEPRTEWSTSFVNAAAERILGAAPSDLFGLPGLDGMLDPDDAEAARQVRARAAAGERGGWQDRRYRHADGHVVTLREHVYPVFDVDGTVRSVQVLAYDVTSEIETRRRLIQTDRLASLGALAAGIAHEINNPVAFIGLAAGQLPRLTDAARIAEIATEIGDAARRIGHIVGELKLFTRIPDGASVIPIDANRMLETAVTLTSAEVSRRGRLDVSLGDLPLVPGRYAGLGQAFVNLLRNCARAVQRAPLGRERVVSLRSRVREEEAVVIEFADTGPEIPKDQLANVFDPYFATERTGTGLGLAIAYDLVRKVGGDVHVESSEAGTRFEIVLPLEPDDAAPARPEASAADRMTRPVTPAASDRRKVLIIDDELALAKALARQLATRYEVDTASTAAEGLAQLAVRPYQAVVCDLRMPDQSGPSIYEVVKDRSPPQAERFIFTTGGSYGQSDDELHERARATGRPILEKPFDGHAFESLVGEVVSAGERKDGPSPHAAP